MSLTVEKCLQAWTNSLRQMNAKADIVFFGDSLTYYGDFSSVFPDKVVCNLGLRGDTIQGMIGRIEQVSMLEPKKVYLMAGINDVNKPSDIFKSLFALLVDTITHQLPGTSIVIQTMLPVNTENFCISCNNEQIRICNRCISMIAREQKKQLIDLYSLYEKNGEMPYSLTNDGIHLAPDAYHIWYSVI